MWLETLKTVQYEVCLGAKAESHMGICKSPGDRSNCIHSFREYNVCSFLTICKSTGQGQAQEVYQKVSQHYKIIKE